MTCAARGYLHGARQGRGKAFLGEGFEVEAVVFDDGVGEELVAHLADLGGGGGLGGGVEGDFHVLASADGSYAVEAELVEATEDGLALGVADGGAVLDVDFGEIGFTHDLTSMDRMDRIFALLAPILTLPQRGRGLNGRERGHLLVGVGLDEGPDCGLVEGVEGLVRVGADEEYLCFHVGFGRDADW